MVRTVHTVHTVPYRTVPHYTAPNLYNILGKRSREGACRHSAYARAGGCTTFGKRNLPELLYGMDSYALIVGQGNYF